MSHPNPSTALARVVVDELIRNHVSTFFIAPGSRSTALALAAVGHDQADCVVMLDERSAGFAALGSSRAGRPAAVVVTSGSAVANLFPAAVEASMGGVPLVLLTADRPPELRGVGANQTIDQVGIFGEYVRLFVDVGVAEDRPESNALWRSSVCRAVHAADGASGRPGPVQLNLPFREPVVPISDDGRTTASPFVSHTDGRPDGLAWSQSTVRVSAAPPLPEDVIGVDRGLVVAGAGADVDWCDRAAAVLGWPLVCESAAGRRPAQAISTAHHLASIPELAADLTPTVTLEVGRVGLSRPFDALIRGSRRVVVDRDQWTDRHRNAEFVYSAYPVVSERKRSGDSTWRRTWLELERTARTGLDQALDREDSISETRVARDVARAARASVLVAASSMPIRDLDVAMEPDSGDVVSNRGASGIDGFVSTVLGVAHARNDAVGLAGDLSMLADQNGFLADTRPHAVFVVIDNNGGGIFSMLPQARHAGEHFERVLGTPHGRDFERYAAVHDLAYMSVTDPGDVTTAVTSRLGDGLHLIHVRTNRNEGAAARARVGAAVRSAVAGGW